MKPLNFIKANKGKVGKDTSGPKAKLKFTNDAWSAQLNSKSYPVADECLRLNGAKVLYSLPCNDKQEPWTKRKLSKPLTSQTAINTIKLYWSKYKHNQNVRGTVKNDIFYIN